MNKRQDRVVSHRHSLALVPAAPSVNAQRAQWLANGGRHKPVFALRTTAAMVLAACNAFSSVSGWSQTLPETTLPTPAATFVEPGGSAISSVVGHTLTVNQSSQSAILNWETFNIGSAAAVQFVQPGPSAAALNRIFDGNPSIIEGRLSANGQIYLINQNGIIFANGAKVDVNSLVASTLEIPAQRFLNGLLSDVAPLETTVPSGFVRVDHGATLVTAREGRVMLLAPAVSNNGVIQARDGQIILAAGNKVFLSASQSSALRGLLVEVDGTQAAENLDLGRLIVDRGNATLAGLAVNQFGRISATTSVVLNGSVRLTARSGTTTGALALGAGSSVEILPDTASTATIQQGQAFSASSVELFGKTVEMRSGASIVAPGGVVRIDAQADLSPADAKRDDVRVYMAAGSRIDVSGLTDVSVPMERNSLRVELRGDELKDSPLQRGAFKPGQIVYVDARVGTPLADVSSYRAQIPRTVSEKLAAGGTVTIRSEGDFVLRDGAGIGFSGGSLRYQDGFVRTSTLISDGRLVDIGAARPDVRYQGVADSFTVTSAKWGPTTTYESASPGTFYQGYAEGMNAGSLTLVAHGLALDGQVTGSASAGAYQRDAARAPLAGRIALGNPDGGDVTLRDYWLGDVRFDAVVPKLDPNFSFQTGGALTALPLDRTATTYVPTAMFSADGIGRVEVYANGLVTVPASGPMQLGARGSIAISAREVELAGSIGASGGSIAVTTRETVDTRDSRSRYGIRLVGGAQLDTAGNWTNDVLLQAGPTISPLITTGGTVRLSSLGDLTIEAGTVIDVTGGGWVNSNSALAGGRGGSIALSVGRFREGTEQLSPSVLTLGGTLLAHGIDAGGSLAVTASAIQIGGTAPADSRILAIDAGFVQTGGFQSYSLTGIDGVDVSAGVALLPSLQSLVPAASFLAAPTGTSVRAVAGVARLPDELRPPVSLTLEATSSRFGVVSIAADARVEVEPQGTLRIDAARQITVEGTLEARAGVISLAMAEPSQGSDLFFPDQSIWLGSNGRLIAAGASRIQTGPDGRLAGEVLDGGRITLDAGKGYVIVEQGGRIDVQGTTAAVDVPVPLGFGRTFERRLVGSAGGSIEISAREGILMDGALAARGGQGARGGELELELLGYRPELLRATGGNFPEGERRFVLAASGTAIPQGLRPGDVVDPNVFNPPSTTVAGRAFVFADQVQASGAETVRLIGPRLDNEYGAVEVVGTVVLSAARNVVIDVPIVRAVGSDADLVLESHRVSFANRPQGLQSLQPVAEGTGRLRVNADQIDLSGNIAMSGFREIALESRGDIQLIGVLQGSSERRLAGSLRTTADLTLLASQIFPSTLAEFDVDNSSRSGSFIRIGQRDAAGPVLSAGGLLRLRSDAIEQGGTLKAPFGSLILAGDTSVDLLPGSLTSVTGRIGGPGGAVAIPFGTTEQNQRDYVYTLDPLRKLILTAPPEKAVQLSAPTITIAGAPGSGTVAPPGSAGAAVIELSGGGDMSAYEFIPGRGGSRDVLDRVNSPDLFAIVPWFAAGSVPYDHDVARGSDGRLSVTAVALQGVDGLADGTYTLLPARYALLPGAYLVRQLAGTSDFLPTDAYVLADGSQVVAGKISTPLAGGAYALDGRTSAFEVAPGSIATTRSEYLTTTASQFFAGTARAQLPGDAGRLAMTGADALSIQGVLDTTHAAAYRGAELDLSIAKLALVANGVNVPGFVNLDIREIQRLGVSSLLLGGTRRRTDEGLRIDVGSVEVRIANSSTQPLQAEEILLVANESVTLEAGSFVEAQVSAVRAGSDRYLVHGSSGIDDGALIRVANSVTPVVVRDNVTRASGSIDIQQDATVRGSSITLDATLSNRLDGVLDTGAGGSLALSAGLVSMGDVAAVEQGLKLDRAVLSRLESLKQFFVRSYSTIDLYGAGRIGGPDLRISLEASGIRGFDNHRIVGLDALGVGAIGTPAGLSPSTIYSSVSAAAGQPATSGTGMIIDVSVDAAGRVAVVPASAGTGYLDGDLVAFAIDGQVLTVEVRAVTSLVGAEIVLGNGVGAASAGMPILSGGVPATLGSGVLQFKAPSIVLDEVAGAGEYRISGFSDVALSGDDVTVRGEGRFVTDAALTISSQRTTGTSGANYAIDAGGILRTVRQAGSGEVTSRGAGAKLHLTGSRIEHGGLIEMRGGAVTLEARGSRSDDDVVILDGGEILAGAVEKAFRDRIERLPAGVVDLRSVSGSVRIAGRVDVSSPIAGESGALRAFAPNGSVHFDAATAQVAGGAFRADVGSIPGFALTNERLNAGGFALVREFRARTGDIVVGDGVVVRSEAIRLAADDGRVLVDGTLDASGRKGGAIEVFARRGAAAVSGDIVVASTAVLDASATTAATESAGSIGDGGRIVLGITDADLSADTTARISVVQGASIRLGGLGAGSGGDLILRAPRLASSADAVAIGTFGGEILGADEVVVETVRVYEATQISATGAAGAFSTATSGEPYAQTLAYVVGQKAAILGRLGADVRLRPGIEIRSSGDMRMSGDWNLCGAAATCDSGWRFDGEPIALTLRANGNLTLEGSLSDGFSGTSIAAGIVRDVPSASLRLVAGADLAQADPGGVRTPDAGAGTITLGTGRLIRTGTGDIELHAATDILLRDGASTIYTAGVPTADPAGFIAVPSNVTGAGSSGLTSRSAQFPDRGGDVRMTAGRNITAAPSGQFISEWLSRYAVRTSAGLLANPQTSWFVLYRDFQQGVGALGGGDVTVVAGGAIENLSVVVPTTGRIGGSTTEAPDAEDVVVTGGGDFRVVSGGDIRGGFFLVDAGTGSLRAGGNVTAAAAGANGQPAMRPVLALGDSRIDVVSGRNLEIQTVVDATAVPQLVRLETGSDNLSTFFHRYTAATGVTLRAGNGDLTLFNDRDGGISGNIRQFGSNTAALTTYPGSFRAISFEGDVALRSSFSMFPVAGGENDFLAGGSLEFAAGFEMLQTRLIGFPSVLRPLRTYFVDGVRPPAPIHGEDTEPFRIYALQGSISASGATLQLAKPALVYAGKDIVDLPIATRNFRITDVTRLQAAGDIRYRIERDPDSGLLELNSNSIIVEGPGRVEVIAGGSVDFGNSVGLVTRGNLSDPTLPEGGSSIFVLAGFSGAPRYEQFRDRYLAPGTATSGVYASALQSYVRAIVGVAVPPEEAWDLFAAMPIERQQPFLRDVYFSELRAAGRSAAAGGGAAAYDRGYQAIETLFPKENVAAIRQDVNLFFSQLKTEQGGNIDIVNPSGLVNAGLATSGEQAKPPSDQGIVTLRGGSIRSSVAGDFLVNQSRVFTVGGGDILLWSSEGNIDAGKGAKTASATPPPLLIFDPSGAVKVDASSSISGSGIGVLIGREGIEPGDVDLVAPRGSVDAGDAGIRSAGNLTIAAVRVIGAENIQVGGVSAGVPVSTAGSLAGALTGVAGASAEAAKAAERVAQQRASETEPQKSASALVSSFLSVEVIGLGDDDERKRTR